MQAVNQRPPALLLKNVALPSSTSAARIFSRLGMASHAGLGVQAVRSAAATRP
jgi:hypothetical protein